jgi:hypothetical protein
VNKTKELAILMVMVLLTAQLHLNAASKTPGVTRDFVKFCEASATDWDAISLTEVTMMLHTGKNGFGVPQSAYKTL